jgi:hypothetical protein
MIDDSFRRAKTGSIAHLGSQPINLAAGALIIIVLGVGGIALGRAYTGPPPEQNRLSALREFQAKATQTTDLLMEKTKALETTQQESIDQLQVVQDQLQNMKGLLAAQQAENKRLSEQLSGLAQAIDLLRQSYANAQRNQLATAAPSPDKGSATTSSARRTQEDKPARRKRAKSRG